jgi:hypothetical protein
MKHLETNAHTFILAHGSKLFPMGFFGGDSGGNET